MGRDLVSAAAGKAEPLITPANERERVALALAVAADDWYSFLDFRESDPAMWESNEEDRAYWLLLTDAALAAMQNAPEPQS